MPAFSKQDDNVELKDLLKQINTSPSTIEFSDVITCIDASYDFTPMAFRNGDLHNAAGENNGSCKIFAFAKKHGLDEQQTLDCFGDYFRQDVLRNPQGDNPKNIRQFM